MIQIWLNHKVVSRIIFWMLQGWQFRLIFFQNSLLLQIKPPLLIQLCNHWYADNEIVLILYCRSILKIIKTPAHRSNLESYFCFWWSVASVFLQTLSINYVHLLKGCDILADKSPCAAPVFHLILIRSFGCRGLIKYQSKYGHWHVRTDDLVEDKSALHQNLDD